GAGKLGADAVLHPAASRIEQLGAVQKLHRGRRSPGAEDALPVDVVNKLLGRLHALSSGGPDRNSRKRSMSRMTIKSRKRIKSKIRIKRTRRHLGLNLTLHLAPHPLPNLNLHPKSFSFFLLSMPADGHSAFYCKNSTACRKTAPVRIRRSATSSLLD